MLNQSNRLAKTFNYADSESQRDVIPITGKVYGLMCRLAGTLTISTSADGDVASRSPWTLINTIVIHYRGVAIHRGRLADFFDRMRIFGGSPVATDIADSVAAHAFEAQIFIPFVAPHVSNPFASILPVGRSDQLEVEIQWGNEESIYPGATAGNRALSATTFEVCPVVNNAVPDPDYLYMTSYREEGVGTTANSEKEIELPTGQGNRYHHLVIAAEDNHGTTKRGLVSTALNTVRLEADVQGSPVDVVGSVSGDTLRHLWDQWTNADGLITGLYPIGFSPFHGGDPSQDLDAAQLGQLRFLIDHDAFATDGYLRVLEGRVSRLPKR